jgi:hypothetical protein
MGPATTTSVTEAALQSKDHASLSWVALSEIERTE